MEYLKNLATKSILFVVFALSLSSVRAEIINIDSDELTKLMDEDVVLIDVRRVDEWKDTGIVPDSKLLTFFDEKGGYNTAEWLANAGEVLESGQPVALICHTGVRTSVISNFLSNQLGWDKVYNVKGGIVDWIKEDRVVSKYEGE